MVAGMKSYGSHEAVLVTPVEDAPQGKPVARIALATVLVASMLAGVYAFSSGSVHATAAHAVNFQRETPEIIAAEEAQARRNAEVAKAKADAAEFIFELEHNGKSPEELAAQKERNEERQQRQHKRRMAEEAKEAKHQAKHPLPHNVRRAGAPPPTPPRAGHAHRYGRKTRQHDKSDPHHHRRAPEAEATPAIPMTPWEKEHGTLAEAGYNTHEKGVEVRKNGAHKRRRKVGGHTHHHSEKK